MREFIQEIKSFFRKGDIVLLMMCLATSAFGCLVVASATNAAKFGGSSRYMLAKKTGHSIITQATLLLMAGPHLSLIIFP